MIRSQETAESEKRVAGADEADRTSKRRATGLAAVAHESWFWLGLVVVLFCVPLFVGLGRTDLDNDESIYSFAVDVMVQSGDWLTPKLTPYENQAFLEKPPLKMWIVGLPIRLGLLPHDEFGLRFWDALFGSIAFVYVFATGRILGGPVCGLAAVLMLFVHGPLLFNHGVRSNAMEAPLLLAYCGGVYHFLAWRGSPGAGPGPGDEGPAPGTRDQGPGTNWHLVAISLYFVLGFMTKFVAALFLPMILATAGLLTSADRRRLRREWRGVAAVSVLAIVLIVPWFLYEYAKVGNELWRSMFGQHVIRRFTASLDPDHLKPWYFYVVTIFENLSGSSSVAVAVLVGIVLVFARTIRRRWAEGSLILLWFGLPVTLISFGTSKVYHYAYPFLPPLALAAGYTVAVVWPVLWRFVAPPLRRLDTALGDRAPGIGRARGVQAVLVGLAACGIIVALVTQAAGTFRLAPGGVVLFRNASVVRPLVFALLALAMAGRLGTAIRLVVPLVLFVALLPVGAYGQTLSRLPLERHPLRSLRDCLQPIADRAAVRDGRKPGVWVEDERLTHPFNYYLRHLGQWEVRDFPSDATVFMHLFDDTKLRPVLLSNARFDTFTRRVREGDASLIEAASRKTGVAVAVLAGSPSRTRTAFVSFPYEVLVLPGPYSVCKPVGEANVR